MDEKYLEKYTSKSANLSQASNNIKVSYVSLIIISIICYVESISILSGTWSLASKFGSSGIGTFYMFILHIIAICLLGIIGLILFLFEYCIKRIIKTSINFKLNKICLFLFTGGFILPILTLILIPIISIAFDIKLGTVGIGKLFPFQTQINKLLQNKNIDITQEQKNEIQPTPNKCNPEEVVFYKESITQNGITKSMAIKPGNCY